MATPLLVAEALRLHDGNPFERHLAGAQGTILPPSKVLWGPGSRKKPA